MGLDEQDTAILSCGHQLVLLFLLLSGRDRYACFPICSTCSWRITSRLIASYASSLFSYLPIYFLVSLWAARNSVRTCRVWICQNGAGRPRGNPVRKHSNQPPYRPVDCHIFAVDDDETHGGWWCDCIHRGNCQHPQLLASKTFAVDVSWKKYKYSYILENNASHKYA